MPIVQMNALNECLKGWHPVCRVKAEQAEALVGPVPVFARSWGPGPTAGTTEPLRFRQVCFAFPKLHFRLLCGSGVHQRTHNHEGPPGGFQTASRCSIVLDFSVRHLQTMLNIESLLLVDGVVDALAD